jgi:hypothetical protein
MTRPIKSEMYRAAGLDKYFGTLCLGESVARTVNLFALGCYRGQRVRIGHFTVFCVLFGIIE